MTDYDKIRQDEAYNRGTLDAKRASFLEEVAHDLGDIITSVLPLASEYRSYESGYHDQMSRKE